MALHSPGGIVDHGTLGGLGDEDHTQYHTDARALTWLNSRSTTDLPEGSNLYFTDARARAAAVSDAAYAGSWNAVTNIAPSKNAVYDKIESLVTGVSSVSAGNSSLTISPTNGAVVATLNTGHANTWSVEQTFAENIRIGSVYDLDSDIFDLIRWGSDGSEPFPYYGMQWDGPSHWLLFRDYGSQLLTIRANINANTIVGDGSGLTNISHSGLTNLGNDDHTQYHTNARALTWLGTRSTTDLAEGSNLYYTQARFNTAFAAKSTTDLAEGTNLYFTNARARTAAVSDAAYAVSWDSVTDIAPSKNAVFDKIESLVTGVSSVSNSDGSLTISPTTGAVVASLNTNHANIWSGVQQFTDGLFLQAHMGDRILYGSDGSVAVHWNDRTLVDQVGSTIIAWSYDGAFTSRLGFFGSIAPWQGGDVATALTAYGLMFSAYYEATGIVGIVAVGNGGTGFGGSYTVGDILYANGTSSFAKLAGVATGNALISGGAATAPSWGKIGLTTHVSGTLPIANGGTNATSYGANRVIFMNSGNTALSSNANFIFDGTNLAIGTSSASAALHVIKTTEQLRVGHSANAYAAFTMNSTGAVTFNIDGSSASTPSWTFDSKITGQADIQVPRQTSAFLIGSNNTISETASGAAYINGQNIRSSISTANQVQKYASVGDAANFIYMRYDTGFSVHTNIGAGDAVGTLYSDVVNRRLLVNLSGNVAIGSHSTISAKLHVIETTEQLRLGYDSSNYLSATVGSSGDVTLTPSGGDVVIGTALLSFSGTQQNWTTAGATKSIELPQNSSLKWAANGSGYRWGVSQFTGGLYWQQNSADTSATALYRQIWSDNGAFQYYGGAFPGASDLTPFTSLVTLVGRGTTTLSPFITLNHVDDDDNSKNLGLMGRVRANAKYVTFGQTMGQRDNSFGAAVEGIQAYYAIQYTSRTFATAEAPTILTGWEWRYYNGSGYSILASFNILSGNPAFTVTKTEEQLRLRYDASNYFSTTVSSAGAVTFNAVGASAGFTFSDDIALADAKNIIANTTTGTKIATATSQKIGFWNATPIIQPTTAVAAATFVANTSGIANDTATFDGYTIGQVVKALRNAGLLA